jgi:hypothetical protein
MRCASVIAISASTTQSTDTPQRIQDPASHRFQRRHALAAGTCGIA